MRTLNSRPVLADYRRAISAAKNDGVALPKALYTVLLARALNHLGPEFYSLFELWKHPRREWSDFIINNEANEIHRHLSQPEDQQLTDDKLAFAAHCIQHGLPTIPTLCSMDLRPSSASLLIPNGLEIEIWERTLDSAPDRIFIKPINGKKGDGAFLAQRHGGRWHYLSHAGSSKDLHEYCRTNLIGRRGWLVQPAISPHRELASHLSPKALCTVRGITCLAHDGPRVLFAALKIPTGKSETDNWAQGYGGNLVSLINLMSGELGTARGSRSCDWPTMFSTDVHPDTQQRISGYRLPHWNAVCKLLLDGQASLPQIPTLGWDIAICDDGPCIVETNWGYGVTLIEVAMQRGIRKELAPTFSYPMVN